MGDELGGLHRIHQQAELGHIQGALAHIIPYGGIADGDDILPHQAQLLDVVIQALALGRDALLRQQVDDLLEAQGMFLVRFAAEDL